MSMDKKTENVLLTDECGNILHRMHMTAVTVYLLKEGILYADADSQAASKAVELIAEIMDGIVADVERIMAAIAEKEEIKI